MSSCGSCCLLALAVWPVLGTSDAASSQSVRSLTRQLNDGTTMPMVGFGTWRTQGDEVENAVAHAICNAGYRHIDCAQIYTNHDRVGAAIAHAIAACGVKRQDLWITSKIWMTDFHPDPVPAAAERILH